MIVFSDVLRIKGEQKAVSIGFKYQLETSGRIIMRVRLIINLLIVTSLLLNINAVLAQTGGQIKLGARQLVFDKEKFAATFKDRVSKFSGPLNGYAAVIIRDGFVLGEVADGWAVRSDGKVLKDTPMTTSTPTDIGSCMKLISFIALLSVLEKKAIKDGASSINTPIYLHKSISNYLPRRWKNFVEFPPTDLPGEQKLAIKRAGSITLAQLMQHKSGFRKSETPYKSPTAPFHMIYNGVKAKNVGVRDYENFNATLLTYLWPMLVDPVAAKIIEDEIDNKKIAIDDRLAYGKIYGNFFEKWMQTNIFNVLKLPIRPSCDAANDYSKRNPSVTFARYYNDLLGGANPSYWSEKDKNGGCHAQGGYYMSMREFATLMATFQTSNVLVSDKVRKLMYDDNNNLTRDARLGWGGTFQSNFAKTYFGAQEIPYQDGANLGFAGVVQLPGGYIAVGAITGRLPGAEGGGDIVVALKDAWGEALRANFEQ